jgi:hypothetical protein
MVLGRDLARTVARVTVDDQHLVGVRTHQIDNFAD